MNTRASRRVFVQIMSDNNPADDCFVIAPEGMTQDCAQGFVDETMRHVGAHAASRMGQAWLAEPLAQAGFVLVQPLASGVS